MCEINTTAVQAALTNHIGRENGVTSMSLVKEITGRNSTAAGERRLREIIAQLRGEGAHICGLPGDGYYMARDEAELLDTCLFLYSRAMSSLVQIAAMKNVSLPDLKGQLHLPT